MNDRQNNFKPWQIIFIFISFLVFLFFLGKEIISWLFQLKSEVVSTIIVVAISGVLTIISVTIGKIFEIRNTIIQQNRGKKISIYEKFLNFLFNIIYSSKKDKMLSEEEIKDFYENNLPDLLLWGESEVIKSYSDLFQSAKIAKEKPEELVRKFEQFIKAIRKDLGYKDLNLKEGELLKTFITDIEQVLKINK